MAKSFTKRPDPRPRKVALVSDEPEMYERATRENEAEAKALTKADKPQSDDDILRDAIERFRIVTEAEMKQRQRELEDLQFDRGLLSDHWPSDIVNARAGSTEGGVTVPSRPCLVINKLDLPVQQILNEAKSAKLSIRIRPKAGSGTTAGATLRQKAIRAIEDDSQANIARYWGLDRAAKCGRGYYRVGTDYANDGDLDQDISVLLIPNQAAVYLDPFHKHPSGMDAEWAFVTDDIPRSEFKHRYPKSKLATAIKDGELQGDEFTSIDNAAPGWVTSDTIRVAEYFYATYKPRTRLFVAADPTDPSKGFKPFWEDELTDKAMIAELRADPTTKVRKVEQREIKWCVICATDILDREDWPGRFIPLIQVLGKQYNVNGDRCFKGVVSNGKDAQRQYNYMRSGLVETMALATKAPWVIAEGQDEGYEDMWDHANVRNYSRLVYKPTSFDGNLVGAPQRNTAEAPIQAFVVAIGMADEDIKSTTGREDASLGKYRSSESGVVNKQRIAQGQQSSSNYLENLANVSMTYEGRVILDLLPHIYDRAGRIIRLLGEDKKEEFGMVGVPFTKGPGGMPVAAPPVPAAGAVPPAGMPPPGMMPPQGAPMPPPEMGAAPPMPGQPAPPQGVPMGGPPAPLPFVPKQPKAKTYTFSDDGDYTCSVSVGPSQATEKDENAAVLETLMQTVPSIAPLVAHIYAKQMDGPMGEELAAVLQKLGPAAALAKDDDDESLSELPPEAQATIFALKNQITQMMQAMQQMQDEAAKKKYAVDVNAQVAQEVNASRERIAQLVEQTKMAIASGRNDNTIDVTQMKGQLDVQLQTLDNAHDRLMAASDAKTAAEADVRKATIMEHGDRRKAEHAEAADTRKASHAEAADGRKAQQAEAGDRRKGDLASHADERKGAMASEADSRAAAAQAAQDARAAADHAAQDARTAKAAADGDTRKADLSRKAAREQHTMGKDAVTHAAKVAPKPVAGKSKPSKK